MTPLRAAPSRRRPAGGFTLVELMVALALGMAVTIAVTMMMARQEGSRRMLTTTNDVAMTGAYLSYLIDRQLRSAGSGYSQQWAATYGCAVNVARDGALVLPRPAPFPTPFQAVPVDVRMSPVIVHAGAGANGSDILQVMTGASGLGELPMRVVQLSATDDAVRVPNTVGLRGGDLVMLAQPGLGCMVQEVEAGFVGAADQSLRFDGDYATDRIGALRLAEFGADDIAWLAPIGNVAGNTPSFQLIGVGAADTLFVHDMLQLDGRDDPQPVAEGVVQMRALYGVDTDADGRLDDWVSPQLAPFDAATLTDGTAVSQERLRRIVAVRVGLVLRSPLVEREPVAPASLTLFGDADPGLQATVELSSDQRRQRHRAIEFTVPLRNVLLLP